MAAQTNESLGSINCYFEKCPYKSGLGPIRGDVVMSFPCGLKCHGSCYQAWLNDKGNTVHTGCPKHGYNEPACLEQGLALKSAKTLAAMGKGGRRRSKRSKRHSKRSKQSKQSTRSKRSTKRSKRS
jgi:hypothetical protein